MPNAITAQDVFASDMLPLMPSLQVFPRNKMASEYKAGGYEVESSGLLPEDWNKFLDIVCFGVQPAIAVAY